MFSRSSVNLILLLGCCISCGGGGNNDDSNDSNPFEAECERSDSTCGQITVGWTVDRFATNASCADVNGTTVKVTVTPVLDTRVAEFTQDCESYLMLTGKLPLTSYTVDAVLLDPLGVALDAEPHYVTLDGPVAVTNVAFDTMTKALPGTFFGVCNSSADCAAETPVCVTFLNDRGYCSPVCNTEDDTECEDGYSAVGGRSGDSQCSYNNYIPMPVCQVSCMGGGCAPGFTCTSIGASLGSFCMLD